MARPKNLAWDELEKSASALSNTLDDARDSLLINSRNSEAQNSLQSDINKLKQIIEQMKEISKADISTPNTSSGTKDSLKSATEYQRRRERIDRLQVLVSAAEVRLNAAIEAREREELLVNDSCTIRAEGPGTVSVYESLHHARRASKQDPSAWSSSLGSKGASPRAKSTPGLESKVSAVDLVKNTTELASVQQPGTVHVSSHYVHRVTPTPPPARSSHSSHAQLLHAEDVIVSAGLPTDLGSSVPGQAAVQAAVAQSQNQSHSQSQPVTPAPGKAPGHSRTSSISSVHSVSSKPLGKTSSNTALLTPSGLSKPNVITATPEGDIQIVSQREQELEALLAKQRSQFRRDEKDLRGLQSQTSNIKHVAITIHDEAQAQNKFLSDMTDDVEAARDRVKKAKDDVIQLKQSGSVYNLKNFFILLVLCVLLVLIFLWAIGVLGH
mmetsp:Transcript_1334/g.2230  ORF Transcript_1334/g.2230 Transcript_1334/m.2230 type:complete len:440 (-) Transcript_1334:388-1707(-)